MENNSRGAPPIPAQVVISLQCSNHKGAMAANIHGARESHKQQTDGSYSHTEASV